jgi:hypothetical protein
VSMTSPTNQIEIITSVQRRRRWAASEKVRMVDPTQPCRKWLFTRVSEGGRVRTYPSTYPKSGSRYKPHTAASVGGPVSGFRPRGHLDSGPAGKRTQGADRGFPGGHSGESSKCSAPRSGYETAPRFAAFNVRNRKSSAVTRLSPRLAARFPLAAAAVAALPVRSCLIDGEAIVCDESSLAMFDLTRSRRSMLPPSH